MRNENEERMRPIIGVDCDIGLQNSRLKIELWQSYALMIELAGVSKEHDGHLFDDAHDVTVEVGVAPRGRCRAVATSCKFDTPSGRRR